MQFLGDKIMYIKTSDQEEIKLGIGDYSVNWGLHLCGLYETEKERDEIIFGYLKQGYSNGDKQLYIHSEQSAESFKDGFTCYCPNCQDGLKDPNYFDILPAQDLYYPEGTFDPRYMDKAVNGYYSTNQANGKRNIRAVAEMVWALNAIPGVEYLMAYESRLNFFVPNKTIIALCLYNISKFSGSVIMNVLRTHPYTLNGGVITKNPFYETPEKWLAKNAPQFLNI